MINPDYQTLYDAACDAFEELNRAQKAWRANPGAYDAYNDAIRNHSAAARACQIPGFVKWWKSPCCSASGNEALRSQRLMIHLIINSLE